MTEKLTPPMVCIRWGRYNNIREYCNVRLKNLEYLNLIDTAVLFELLSNSAIHELHVELNERFNVPFPNPNRNFMLMVDLHIGNIDTVDHMVFFDPIYKRTGTGLFDLVVSKLDEILETAFGFVPTEDQRDQNRAWKYRTLRFFEKWLRTSRSMIESRGILLPFTLWNSSRYGWIEVFIQVNDGFSI